MYSWMIVLINNLAVLCPRTFNDIVLISGSYLPIFCLSSLSWSRVFHSQDIYGYSRVSLIPKVSIHQSIVYSIICSIVSSETLFFDRYIASTGDSFTQYNEAGIGVSITNNGYAQLVSIFTINCDIAIYADTGGSCDLTNSNSSFGNFGLVAVGLGSTEFTGKVLGDSIPEVDTITLTSVFDASNLPRRPYDGQSLWFKINLDNYPDAVGSGVITQPLRELGSIQVLNGGSGFSAVSPPNIIIRDADGTVQPKGPQSIIAEVSPTINDAGEITAIDVVSTGRNYLASQNIVVDIEGNTGLATAIMSPIYFTVSAATPPTSPTGITTVTFNEFIPYELFDDDDIELRRISRILTSSHSFEYIGTGTDINTATPLKGAVPIKANEVVAREGAQIPFTSTDQKGNFDIGEGIQIDQTTSSIRGRDFSRAIQAEVTPLILALR